VFCITHLPQLAAYGNQHFRVEKNLNNDRTTTSVKQLAWDERIIELAQMFGELTEGTLTSAKELLAQAQDKNH
jgi:DNA repair protein RecN (Recombination protein N)